MQDRKLLSRRNMLSLLTYSCAATLLSGCSLGSIAINSFAPAQGTSGGGAPHIVRTAQSQLGTRYTLGGESPSSGFDCSGLIWWAYDQHGITVPRVTKDQAYAGRAAPLNSLAAGDILVFASSSAPNSLHTAIYVDNGTFIHSPNSRSHVREDSLSNTYWQEHLAIARRIV